MQKRHFWTKKIEELLALRSVLWLSGVRRSGKTTLCQSLEGFEYFDCELPRARQELEDVERFLKKKQGAKLVIDEIHRLQNPSEILKIAADHYPKIKIIATGSSTLSVKRKFKDTLTGRKHELWLTPANSYDLKDFNIQDIKKRCLYGGLPPFLLSKTVQDLDFQEWLDSYWAKDIQELYVVDKRNSFFRFIELLFRQSGQLFEAQSFSAPCEISRTTVMNYLEMLESTHLALVLRPFVGGSAVEIKSQPKVYGFDTGFVSFLNGIADPDSDDLGLLFEHLVLNELYSFFNKSSVFYWRSKSKAEVDFVVKKGRGKAVHAIECKLKSKKFDPSGIKAFRKLYPTGNNFLVSLDTLEDEIKRYDNLTITHISLNRLLPILNGGEERSFLTIF